MRLALLACLPLLACSGESGEGPAPEENVDQSSAGLTCVTLVRGLTATGDAMIAQDPVNPTLASANFGSLSYTQTGAFGAGTREALYTFDLSSIPANVVISSASLALRKGAGGGAGTTSLHAVTAPWSEGSVTYGSFAGSHAAPALGSVASGSLTLGAHAVFDVASTVQSWNAGARPNYGFHLRETGGRTTWGASEASFVSRPKLTVCYQPPTCSDGLQNGTETGLDCGGSCAPCVGPCVCAAPAPCQGTPYCDPNDNNACIYPDAPDGTPCVDANVCNGTETCQAGVCTSGVSPPACSDGLGCNLDTCDPTLGCTFAVPFWRAPLVAPSFVDIGAAGEITVIDWEYYSVPLCHGTSGPLLYASRYDVYGNLAWKAYIDESGGPAHVDGSGTLSALTVQNWGGSSYVSLLQVDNAGLAQYHPSYYDAPGTPAGLGGDDSGKLTAAVFTMDPVSYGPSFEVAQVDASGILWQENFAVMSGAFAVARVGMDAAGAAYVGVNLLEGGSLDLVTQYLSGATADAHVFKLGAGGNVAWVHSFASTGTQTIHDLDTDDVGNTYVVGSFTGQLSYGAGYPLIASAGGEDAFVVQLGSNGVAQWGRVLGGAGTDRAYALAIGPSGLHVSGRFDGVVDFGGGPVVAPNGSATFDARYSAGGVLQGVIAHPGVPTELTMDVDCTGKVALAGTAPGFAPFGQPPSPSSGFVAKLGTPPASCGAGSCSGAQYCDGCGCRPAADPLSVTACGCALVNPACGEGSCVSGTYCEGSLCGGATCYPAGSAVTYAMCGFGALTNTCLQADPPKRVFTTAATFALPFGGLPGADAACQSEAVNAGLSGTYKAWLSDATGMAKDRLTHSRFAPYVLVTGTVVANNWDDLLDGSLQNAIDRTATGAPAPMAIPASYSGSTNLGGVWTGTDAQGWSAQNLALLVNGLACYGADACGDEWTNSQGDPWFEGLVGLLTSSAAWTEGFSTTCTNPLPFYCFEQ